MPRGYPDYQNPVNQVAGRLVDFSSIVTAQLGLSTLDGLGRLVWWDTFHNTLSAWHASYAGSGHTPAIDTSLAEIPPSCVKFDVTNPIDICTSFINKQLLFTHPSTFGVDFSLLYNGGNSHIDVRMGRYYQGVNLGSGVRYKPLTGEVQVYNGSAYATVITLPKSSPTLLWLPLKLVADFDNQRLLRLCYLMDSISLVDIPLVPFATTECDQIVIDITAYGDGVGSLSQYVGHVYLTTDEP